MPRQRSRSYQPAHSKPFFFRRQGHSGPHSVEIQDYPEAEHRGPGFDHVGFKVESVETFKKDLETLISVDPANLAPRPASNIPEQKVVLGLLQSCRYGQYHVPDAEGNYVDVSQH
jgi:hypothetical protein